MPRRPTPPDPAERQRIIDATLYVIAKHGLRKAKLATIAERAGIAYGTLYRHFEDRDALLLAATKERAERFKREWDHLGRDGDVIDRIIELGTATLRRTEAEPESRDLYVAMLVAGPATGPAATKVFASMTNLLMGRLRECVDEAKQLGYFGDLSSDAVTVTILGFSTIYMLPYSTSGKPDWPEVIGQLELLIRRLAGTKDAHAQRRNRT